MYVFCVENSCIDSVISLREKYVVCFGSCEHLPVHKFNYNGNINVKRCF